MSNLSDMVANQVASVKRVKGAVVQLKVDSETKLVKNIREWNEKLEEAFYTTSMRDFLEESYNVEVPKNLEVLSIHQRSVELQVKESVERMKRLRSRDVVKIEAEESAASSSSAADASSASSSSSSSSSAHFDEKVKSLEDVIRENATEMYQIEEKRRKEKMVVGKKSPTLFINPLTMVYPDTASQNPFATVEIEVRGRVRMCELESEKKRSERMDAWKIVTDTLSAIERSVWQHVSVGNVFSLISTINSHFEVEERSDIADKLVKEMSSIRVKESESFKTFVSRYRELLEKFEQISLSRDEGLERKRLKEILQYSSSSTTAKTFSHWYTFTKRAEFEQMSCLEILEIVEPLITESERQEKREKQSEGSESEEEKKKSKAQKRKEKKERKKKEKQEEEEAKALLASKAKGRAQAQAQAQAPAQQNTEVIGSCLHFQYDRCSFGDKCKFRHVKLTPAKVKELERILAGKKEAAAAANPTTGVTPLVCYSCGQVGHIASKCPFRAGQALQRQGSSSRANHVFVGASGSASGVGGGLQQELAALMGRYGSHEVISSSLSLSQSRQGGGEVPGKTKGSQ